MDRQIAASVQASNAASASIYLFLPDGANKTVEPAGTLSRQCGDCSEIMHAALHHSDLLQDALLLPSDRRANPFLRSVNPARAAPAIRGSQRFLSPPGAMATSCSKAGGSAGVTFSSARFSNGVIGPVVSYGRRCGRASSVTNSAHSVSIGRKKRLVTLRAGIPAVRARTGALKEVPCAASRQKFSGRRTTMRSALFLPIGEGAPSEQRRVPLGRTGAS
jgi:hypothetical protein